MGTSCHKAIMVMAKCACYMMVMQIYYAHPDFLGFEHPVCSLTPHSSSLLSYLPIYIYFCVFVKYSIFVRTIQILYILNLFYGYL